MSTAVGELSGEKPLRNLSGDESPEIRKLVDTPSVSAQVESSASSCTESTPCSEVDDSHASDDEVVDTGARALHDHKEGHSGPPVTAEEQEYCEEEEKKCEPFESKDPALNEEHIAEETLRTSIGERREKHSNCPLGHGLAEFSTPRAFYSCDGCGRPQLYGTTLFGCRACNFDVCSECVHPDVVEHAANHQLRCPDGHGLIDMRWEETRLCNGCRRRLEPEGRRFLACAKCDYDLCGKCCGFKQLTYYEVLGVAPDATMEEIQEAAWVRSLECRKEAVKNPRQAHVRSDAIVRFNDIAVAHSILGDPESRVAYDQRLAEGITDDEDSQGERGTKHNSKAETHFWWLRPPGTSRKPDAKPSVLHGTYVIGAGAIYTPIAAAVTGVGFVCFGVWEGSKCVGEGLSRGVSGVSRGFQQAVLRKTPKGRSVKVFVNETSAFRERMGRANRTSKFPAWRNLSRGITEPLHGVVQGTAVVLVYTITGVGAAVGGVIAGTPVVVCGGAHEVSAALRGEGR